MEFLRIVESVLSETEDDLKDELRDWDTKEISVENAKDLHIILEKKKLLISLARDGELALLVDILDSSKRKKVQPECVEYFRGDEREREGMNAFYDQQKNVWEGFVRASGSLPPMTPIEAAVYSCRSEFLIQMQKKGVSMPLLVVNLDRDSILPFECEN